jgi:hypothetical protein
VEHAWVLYPCIFLDLINPTKNKAIYFAVDVMAADTGVLVVIMALFVF